MDKTFLKSVVLLLVLLTINMPVNAAGILDRPSESASKEQTEGENGIMSTLVLIYTKTRNAVKSAYNEVMYFKEMRDNFKNMGAWFEKAKDRTKSVWDKTTDLFTDPKNMFTSLDQMEDIFDEVNSAAYTISNELNDILVETELTYDKIVGEYNDFADETPLRARMPNTDKVISFVDEKFGFNKIPVNTDKDETDAKYYAKLEENKKTNPRQFSEEEMVDASKLVASAAMSTASMYKSWAESATKDVEKTKEKFKDVKGANGQELEACWYAIEQTNANNKLLLNNLEELKVFQATLGIYLYETSDNRTQELTFRNQLNSMSTIMESELED